MFWMSDLTMANKTGSNFDLTRTRGLNLTRFLSRILSRHRDLIIDICSGRRANPVFSLSRRNIVTGGKSTPVRA
ncbi:hypothetical protein Cni_G14024 [Canna indica]|uniref:Uncharacterized protein n=1 Tax=Canna indica TaxID=4628 RepID=A0AAQ3QD94_9LILI|nr:hypothetical protein Cni_G14024 [Canna indica]